MIVCYRAQFLISDDRMQTARYPPELQTAVCDRTPFIVDIIDVSESMDLLAGFPHYWRRVTAYVAPIAASTAQCRLLAIAAWIQDVGQGPYRMQLLLGD